MRLLNESVLFIFNTDIPPPTVQLLFSELLEVDWFTFGVLLGVTVRKLQEIKASNPQGGVQQWKIEMFQSWLDSTPTASWEDIIRALEQADHVTLATRLRSKYPRHHPLPGVCNYVSACVIDYAIFTPSSVNYKPCIKYQLYSLDSQQQ